MIKFPASDWAIALSKEFQQDYYLSLLEQINLEAASNLVYPPENEIFRAFELCPLKKVKVVIIGQDPYHGPGQAHGLSFSVNSGVKVPPSLKNIYKELNADLQDFKIPTHGNLTDWAIQGVLLLNAVLTVQPGLPASHRSRGWEKFTDAVIRVISEQCSHCVFMLWGQFAQAKAHLIDDEKHLVLRSAHPSPLARGAFFGNKHFSRCNDFLMQHHRTPINWQLPKSSPL